MAQPQDIPSNLRIKASKESLILVIHLLMFVLSPFRGMDCRQERRPHCGKDDASGYAYYPGRSKAAMLSRKAQQRETIDHHLVLDPCALCAEPCLLRTETGTTTVLTTFSGCKQARA